MKAGVVVLDRFVLWWCRTWLLWCLTLTLIFMAVPIKTFQVGLEAITGDALWQALAEDLDVGESVESQAEQIVGLVPVDELHELTPMLGEDRTQVLVEEAEEIRRGVAKEVGTATSKSVNKVVGKSLPRFLLGEDLTGNRLSGDLMLDLRPVRSDLEAWLTQAGRLIVDAISEATQAKITSYMAPAVSSLAPGKEVEELRRRLIALEAIFEGLGHTMRGIGSLVGHLEDAGLLDDEVSAESARRLTKVVEALAEMGIHAVQRGHTVLREVESSGEPLDWEKVVERITQAMVEDAVKDAKTQSDVFATELTQIIVGNGTYTLPAPVRTTMVEQLRPVQVVMVPLVTGGRALNAIMLALMWTTVLLAVLVAGRTRRAAFWLGCSGLVIGYSAQVCASVLKTMAMAMAEGLGAMGLAVAEAGQIISKMMGWAWMVIRFFLDMEPVELLVLEGWGTQDVLESAIFGVFDQSVVGRLDGWGSAVVLFALCALVIWASLVVLEGWARRRPAEAPGSFIAVLQQPGGMRLEDPLLLLIPRHGESASDTRPHAAPSRLLVRGVFVDLSWLLVFLLSTFVIIGLNTFLMLGPMGGGAVVVPSSILTTGILAAVSLMTVRLLKPGGRTVTGMLSGETLVDATGATQPWRIRSLLAQLPWLAAIGAGTLVGIATGSANLGMCLAMLLLLVAEILVIVMSKGQRTLGSTLMGRQVQTQSYGITPEDRRRMIQLLTHAGTLWSLAWGLLTIGFFGLGLYALCTGIATGALWFMGRNGPPRQRQVRTSAFLRVGNWLSLDFIGLGLGIAALWLLQDPDAREYFCATPASPRPAQKALEAEGE